MTFAPGTPVHYGSGLARRRGVVMHQSGPHYCRVKDDRTGKEHTVPTARLFEVESAKTPAHKLTSKPDTRPVKLSAVPKDLPVRSRKYLDWIRAKPCAHCGKLGPSEAAHYGGPGKSGGTSTKASDLFTVPLCTPCHAHYHQTGHLPGGTPETTRADHYRWERDLLAEWISKGGAL